MLPSNAPADFDSLTQHITSCKFFVLLSLRDNFKASTSQNCNLQGMFIDGHLRLSLEYCVHLIFRHRHR